MKALLAAVAVTTSFGSLANERNMGQMQVRVAQALAERAQKCNPQFDGVRERAQGSNSEIGDLVGILPLSSPYAIVSNGLTACYDNRLANTQLEDGRRVIASINLGNKTVSISTATPPATALYLAGLGVSEAMEQIQRRGGSRPPAHMLQPLAVVEDKEARQGFTLVPNDANVIRAVSATPVAVP